MKTLEICTSFISDAQRFHAAAVVQRGENVFRVCIKGSKLSLEQSWQ